MKVLIFMVMTMAGSDGRVDETRMSSFGQCMEYVMTLFGSEVEEPGTKYKCEIRFEREEE